MVVVVVVVGEGSFAPKEPHLVLPLRHMVTVGTQNPEG